MRQTESTSSCVVVGLFGLIGIIVVWFLCFFFYSEQLEPVWWVIFDTQKRTVLQNSVLLYKIRKRFYTDLKYGHFAKGWIICFLDKLVLHIYIWALCMGLFINLRNLMFWLYIYYTCVDKHVRRTLMRSRNLLIKKTRCWFNLHMLCEYPIKCILLCLNGFICFVFYFFYIYTHNFNHDYIYIYASYDDKSTNETAEI